MALRFIDSFDHYATGDITQKWTSVSASGLTGFGGGRHGAAVFHGNAGFCTKTLDNQPTWIVGVAFLPPSPQFNGVLRILDGGSTQMGVQMDSAGRLQVISGASTLATGTTVLSGGIWYYIELKTTINNSTGSYTLRINGATELTASGVDTQFTGNAFASQIQILSYNNQSGQTFDDFYVCDGTGSAPYNDLLGDVRIDALYPNAAGDFSQFVPSAGANYTDVDETQQDGDATFVQSANVGDKDTYNLQDAPVSAGTVYGVQVLAFAKKTDSGVRSLRSVLRLAGNEIDNGVDHPLAVSYTYYPDIYTAKPGGGAFTIADINNLQAGVKVAA